MEGRDRRGSAVYNIVREAILNRQQIIADYQGHRREMCPHVLGWTKGREKAMFYQFGGGSKSGLGPYGSEQNWRCVFIAQLSNVVAKDGRWYSATNYEHLSQPCVEEIDVKA
jgi:hypothetical protein